MTEHDNSDVDITGELQRVAEAREMLAAAERLRRRFDGVADVRSQELPSIGLEQVREEMLAERGRQEDARRERAANERRVAFTCLDSRRITDLERKFAAMEKRMQELELRQRHRGPY